MSPHNLDKLVRALVESRDQEIRDRKATVTIEGRLHAPSCTPEMASLVFGTLLDNALARCGSAGCRIRIGWLPSSDESRVFFLKDNGDTPTEEVIGGARPTIPDRRTEEAVVAVERHGGSLWGEVEPGMGTTFFVIFGQDPSDDPTGEQVVTDV